MRVATWQSHPKRLQSVNMVLSILIPHPFTPEFITLVCDCSFLSSPPSHHWTVGTPKTLLFYRFILYLFYLASVTYGFNKYLWFQQLLNKYLWVTLNEWKQQDILNKYCLAFTKSLLIRDQSILPIFPKCCMAFKWSNLRSYIASIPLYSIHQVFVSPHRIKGRLYRLQPLMGEIPKIWCQFKPTVTEGHKWTKLLWKYINKRLACAASLKQTE